MAIQGDIKDLDMPLLINTATFGKGVIEVECPPLGRILIYFRNGKIVSIIRNGEMIENLLEIVDTTLSLIRCRNGTFLMENLDGTDVEVPTTMDMDVNQLTLWVSSLIDEIKHHTRTLPDDAKLRLVPEKAKKISDPFNSAFLLLAVKPLASGTTLKDLRKNLPLRDDTLEYFVGRLVDMGVIEVVKEESEKPQVENRGRIKVFFMADGKEREVVLKVLRSMGYEVEAHEGDLSPDANLYVVDLNGKGFLWANSLFGLYASRTLLIGSEDIKPARFIYLKKPLKEEEVREALESLLEVKA